MNYEAVSTALDHLQRIQAEGRITAEEADALAEVAREAVAAAQRESDFQAMLQSLADAVRVAREQYDALQERRGERLQ